MCRPALFFFFWRGNKISLEVYSYALERLLNMSNLNMGADFHAYLETLGCTEAQFKALSIVDRSAIHLNFGRLTLSVAGLVEDPAVASFDGEKNPGAQEILTGVAGMRVQTRFFSRSPLVAEVVAENSFASATPLKDVATALNPVILGDHCGTDVPVIVESLWDASSTEAENVKVRHARDPDVEFVCCSPLTVIIIVWVVIILLFFGSFFLESPVLSLARPRSVSVCA